MSDGGKGSAPRPMQIDREQYSNNWDAIFKKNKTTSDYQDVLSTEDCMTDALERMVQELNNSEKK
jgi:hypothetical protein